MSNEIQNISWPGWETVDLIGRGSFGAVYKIQRNLFGNVEVAALKVISIPQSSSDIEEMYSDGYDEESITITLESHLKRIVDEYSLMRKMNGSANVVNCDDVLCIKHENEIGWDILIKMELLTPLTKDLPEVIREETVIQLAKDMCAALELCKKYEVVHRDIKPQNIFISEHGNYKLGDFGVAKTVEKTMGGTKIGTYKYMAPEVYHSMPYGSAADIYSLGLVLYWMLNERRMPFMPLPPEKIKAGMEEMARERRFSGEEIPAPAHGSEALKQIVLKACAYEPADRYASATEMLCDLSNLFYYNGINLDNKEKNEKSFNGTEPADKESQKKECIEVKQCNEPEIQFIEEEEVDDESTQIGNDLIESAQVQIEQKEKVKIESGKKQVIILKIIGIMTGIVEILFGLFSLVLVSNEMLYNTGYSWTEPYSSYESQIIARMWMCYVVLAFGIVWIGIVFLLFKKSVSGNLLLRKIRAPLIFYAIVLTLIVDGFMVNTWPTTTHQCYYQYATEHQVNVFQDILEGNLTNEDESVFAFLVYDNRDAFYEKMTQEWVEIVECSGNYVGGTGERIKITGWGDSVKTNMTLKFEEREVLIELEFDHQDAEIVDVNMRPLLTIGEKIAMSTMATFCMVMVIFVLVRKRKNILNNLNRYKGENYDK